MIIQDIKNYSLCNDPSLNEWANKLLWLCAEPILATCSAHRISSVILTGSFSRGEASVFWDNNLPTLAGDIEFLLVSKNHGKLAKERSFYDSFKNDLGNTVSESVNTAIDVDIGLVSADYFSKKLPSTIFLYDLITYGKTLFGKNYLIDKTIKAETIVQDDALALLLNRTIELLILSENTLSEKYSYHLVKILLDMAGSLLAFTGNYVAPYRERPAALEKLSKNVGIEIPTISLFELGRLVEHAAQIKSGLSRNAEKRKELVAIDDTIKNYLAQLIFWQMKKIIKASDNIHYDHILKCYFSREPFKTVVREWGKYCIHPFRSNDALKTYLLPLALLRGSPKNLIYSAAIKCFFYNVFKKEEGLTAANDLRVFNRGGHTPEQCCRDACLLWNQVIKHN